MVRQIFLDTETTGISPQQGHRIIEVGCLEAVDRKITENHFHYYINPNRAIDEGAQRVHGITSEFLQDKPTFDVIAQDFIDYVRGAEIIIHNAPFDVGFLNAELQRVIPGYAGLDGLCQITDTLAMARKKHPGQKNSLDALCRRYDIDNTHRDLHGALLDAKLLASMYFRMTGGQAALFVDQANHSTTASEKVTADKVNTDSKQRSLHVNPLSSQDQQAHQDYCSAMKESSDCLWPSMK